MQLSQWQKEQKLPRVILLRQDGEDKALVIPEAYRLIERFRNRQLAIAPGGGDDDPEPQSPLAHPFQEEHGLYTLLYPLALHSLCKPLTSKVLDKDSAATLAAIQNRAVGQLREAFKLHPDQAAKFNEFKKDMITHTMAVSIPAGGYERIINDGISPVSPDSHLGYKMLAEFSERVLDFETVMLSHNPSIDETDAGKRLHVHLEHDLPLRELISNHKLHEYVQVTDQGLHWQHSPLDSILAYQAGAGYLTDISESMQSRYWLFLEQFREMTKKSASLEEPPNKPWLPDLRYLLYPWLGKMIHCIAHSRANLENPQESEISVDLESESRQFREYLLEALIGPNVEAQARAILNQWIDKAENLSDSPEGIGQEIMKQLHQAVSDDRALERQLTSAALASLYVTSLEEGKCLLEKIEYSCLCIPFLKAESLPDMDLGTEYFLTRLAGLFEQSADSLAYMEAKLGLSRITNQELTAQQAHSLHSMPHSDNSKTTPHQDRYNIDPGNLAMAKFLAYLYLSSIYPHVQDWKERYGIDIGHHLLHLAGENIKGLLPYWYHRRQEQTVVDLSKYWDDLTVHLGVCTLGLSQKTIEKLKKLSNNP